MTREFTHRSSCSAYAFRLRPGDDLRLTIESVVKGAGIAAGAIMTCVGSLAQADLRLADESLPGPMQGPFEIVGLVGTAGAGGSHLHIALADARGQVHGGHVRPGCIVHTTAEIVLGVMPELTFDRSFDAQTGFDELDIKAKGE